MPQKMATFPITLTYLSESILELAATMHFPFTELPLIATTIGPLKPPIAIFEVVEI